MIEHTTHIRVRYAETDQMGLVYHGNFAQYFEVGRAEMIRALGYSYRDMEAEGVVMPVTGMRVRFLRPVRYDEHIRLRTSLPALPGRRVTMVGEVFNEADRLCVQGRVTLAFVDLESGRSTDPPEKFIEIIKAHWKEG